MVEEARKSFHLPSENWTYPTRYHFGFPKDKYYAEIWSDGMDWQSNYWLLESEHWNKPQIYPAVVFDHNEDEAKINPHEFEELFQAIMSYRRDILWLKTENPKGIYGDSIWSFTRLLRPIQRKKNCDCLARYRVRHAHQERVEFWLNTDLAPEDTKIPNPLMVGNMTITTQFPDDSDLKL